MSRRRKVRKSRGRKPMRGTGSDRWSPSRTLLAGIGTIVTAVIAGLILHEILKHRDSGGPLKLNAVISSESVQGAAVQVANVSTERAPAIQGYTWVFAKHLDLDAGTLSELNALYAKMLPEVDAGKESAFERWVAQRGGVTPEYLVTRLVLEGNRTHDVQITGAHVETHCTAPLHGTILFSPPAALESTPRIGFDLDLHDPPAVVAKGGVLTAEGFFGSHTISVAPGKQQVLDVVAETKRHSCRYTVLLDVLDGSKRSVFVVNHDGAPFAVSAQAPGRPKAPYAGYEAVYLGGVASPAMNDTFVAERPSYNPAARFETGSAQGTN